MKGTGISRGDGPPVSQRILFPLPQIDLSFRSGKHRPECNENMFVAKVEAIGFGHSYPCLFKVHVCVCVLLFEGTLACRFQYKRKEKTVLTKGVDLLCGWTKSLSHRRNPGKMIPLQTASLQSGFSTLMGHRHQHPCPHRGFLGPYGILDRKTSSWGVAGFPVGFSVRSLSFKTCVQA